MREKLTFQKRGPDANGDPLGDWSDAFGFALSAHVRPLVGTETVMAERLGGVQPYLFTVRDSSETAQITTDWRLLWKGRALNIRAVTLNAKRDGYDILADDGVAT